MFRAGDRVKHRPTGEVWILATDEDDGRVMPAGWPECQAMASDCELVEAATDEKRIRMLIRVADSVDPYSRRAATAGRQLAEE